MGDELTEEMICKLSAERVRLVHENERLRAEITRLKQQVSGLGKALSEAQRADESEPPTDVWFPGIG